MKGKTCLVTGATDGHGKAVAMALARQGAEVVLHGRSRDKILAVQDEIAAATDGKAPEILLCDFAIPREIDFAIRSYLASGRPLHVLVNNAGLVGLQRRENEVGHELTFAVNYLAMFRLTLGLLPRLRESAPARIVNVSSDTYRMASIDFDDLMLENGYGMMKAYGRSKLAILYFSLELARRIEGSGVSVNAIDPGPIASNIGADNPGLAYRLMGPLIRHLFPSAERAARTAVMAATASELEAASGGYYRSRKKRDNPLDFDESVSWRLWQASLDLCDLPADVLESRA